MKIVFCWKIKSPRKLLEKCTQYLPKLIKSNISFESIMINSNSAIDQWNHFLLAVIWLYLTESMNKWLKFFSAEHAINKKAQVILNLKVRHNNKTSSKIDYLFITIPFQNKYPSVSVKDYNSAMLTLNKNPIQIAKTVIQIFNIFHLKKSILWFSSFLDSSFANDNQLHVRWAEYT